MSNLSPSPGVVWASAASELQGADAGAVLAELAEALCREVEGMDSTEVARAFAAREELGSTALGGGVAAPHCRSARVEEPRVVVGRHREGIDFDAPDGQPVRLFVALASPASSPAGHLRLLADLARRVRDQERIERALSAASIDGVVEALAAAEDPAG